MGFLVYFTAEGPSDMADLAGKFCSLLSACVCVF